MSFSVLCASTGKYVKCIFRLSEQHKGDRGQSSKVISADWLVTLANAVNKIKPVTNFINDKVVPLIKNAGEKIWCFFAKNTCFIA